MAEYDLTDFLDPEELDTKTMGEILDEDDRSREELIHDAYDSEGRDIFTDIKSLYSTLKMVNTNFELLSRKRDEFVNKDPDYWIKKSRPEMQDFLKEYMRLLHNYAASVHTLISHTYTFLDRYENDKQNLKPRYFSEISSRDLETKVNLLKQIRHYTQKNWAPPLSASISPSMDEPGSGELELRLEKDEMMDWDGWDSEVEDFLKSLDDEIPITDLAEDYQTEVNDFYEWFRMFLLSEFYDEVFPCITASLQLERQMEEEERRRTEGESRSEF